MENYVLSQSPVANRVCLLYLWKRLSGKGSQPEIQGSPENRLMKRKNSRISPLPPFVSYQKERRYATPKAQHPLKIPGSHYNRMRCKDIHTVITARKKEPSIFRTSNVSNTCIPTHPNVPDSPQECGRKMFRPYTELANRSSVQPRKAAPAARRCNCVLSTLPTLPLPSPVAIRVY